MLVLYWASVLLWFWFGLIWGLILVQYQWLLPWLDFLNHLCLCLIPLLHLSLSLWLWLRLGLGLRIGLSLILNYYMGLGLSSHRRSNNLLIVKKYSWIYQPWILVSWVNRLWSSRTNYIILSLHKLLHRLRISLNNLRLANIRE